MTNTNELTAKLKAAEETVELQRFKLERQAEDLHQAKSLESIHRDKRYEVEGAFSSYKHEAEKNSYRLAGEVCRLEDELEAAQSRIAELEARERHSERQSVIDGLAASGETWEEIQEYMKSWEAARAAGIKLQIEGE